MASYGSQIIVWYLSPHHGLRIVQPLPALCDKYQLAIADGIVRFTLDCTYEVLVSNLATQPQHLAKHHIPGSATPHSLVTLPIRVMGAEVPEITTEGMGGPTGSVSTDRLFTDRLFPLNGPSDVTTVNPVGNDKQLKTGNSAKKPIKLLEKMDLSYLPSSHRAWLRQLLWDLNAM